MRDVLVIGGNRYFGKRLIDRLIAAGDRVTVLNRGSASPPAGAIHLVADRDDEAALNSALGDRTFDVVVDQVCYTPRQAAIARRVFGGGRTRRYVLTSTIEVYEYEDSLVYEDIVVPVREDAVDPRDVPVDLQLPWHKAEFLDTHYGEGKRQAEAVFAAGSPTADGGTEFTYTAVRVAHVLGGADDFTGRLDHYAQRIRTGAPIAVPTENRPATYIHVEEIADFLFWTVGEDFAGPVNAASHGLLTTEELCAAVALHIPDGRTVFQNVDVGQISPFSFARSYGMDNSRATELGFTFGHVQEWLPRAVAETLGAAGGQGE
ncbi:NAD-dependent epimerase/dehydratase family protein [Streptomyces sp. NBC_00576]|uniref:NAD-dependent epimerase/dehydratase family protein n=1 Tax=Streptomyces sp. NBC_00576 TaxID=2903665 RepID=UPI002E822401|nr:NAD-dependent epimerase/dehydratase family protein [Streptomyces sp. NBC_00576]WUB70972.1 NAD-dependent epimerase/dehydratase family protein [Streptomyces sp. NBC_00576]